MSSEWEAYKAGVRGAAPAPHEETEDYARFSAWFMPVAFGLAVALCYFMAWKNLDGTLIDAARVSEVFPPAAGRIAFFEVQDKASQGAYTATLAAGLVILPAFLVLNGIGYWKTVVAPDRCRRVSRLTMHAVLPLLVVFAIFFLIAFVHVPEFSVPGRRGMSRIIFWPAFPALGGALLVLCAHVIFVALVGGLKFLFGLVGKNR
ncbi:hypothetical protein [Tropicibacter oceani]|uniref:Yip1 domain-containing protein n=1 Tax=Tropicibacter oceani TaxID=3058420 RepID=A0ABY8QG92_9RHOB|nr:hypothetical protein [Tropicibacter oceani]WGW03534.1 hypothetical protein QF118_16650 [Tropicibacter oceani]